LARRENAHPGSGNGTHATKQSLGLCYSTTRDPVRYAGVLWVHRALKLILVGQ